jgi:hypothetical protein
MPFVMVSAQRSFNKVKYYSKFIPFKNLKCHLITEEKIN